MAGSGVGQAMRYKEDDRFLTDAGRFQDEIISPDQFLSSSFMDYVFPQAKVLPSFDASMDGEILYPTEPPDIKGVSEVGTICALAVVMNALMDAFAFIGLTHVDMPATPVNVWRASQAAKARRKS